MLDQDPVLFLPPHLGCPECNKAKNSRNALATTAHTHLPDGRIIGYGCGHEFTMYDALKRDCSGGIFGILGVFAHWLWDTQQSIEAGKLATIPLATPQGLTPFAVFLTTHASQVHPGLGIVPTVLHVTDVEVLISAPATTNATPEQLGTAIQLSVFVYAYMTTGARGWKRLFYESLMDFSQRRYSLSVFKLATSIELYADLVFEKYLVQTGLPERLRKRMLRSARDWSARSGTIADLIPSFLPDSEARKFTTALGPFRTKVRDLRNSFAHNDADAGSHRATEEAYEAAFDVLWVINSLDQALHVRTQ